MARQDSNIIKPETSIRQYRSLVERRRECNMNSRIEATNGINPITGYGYEPVDTQGGKFYDSLQAHLGAMEEREPSLSQDNRGLVRRLSDVIDLFNRNREGVVSKVHKSRKEKFMYDSTFLDLRKLIRISDAHKYNIPIDLERNYNIKNPPIDLDRYR